MEHFAMQKPLLANMNISSFVYYFNYMFDCDARDKTCSCVWCLNFKGGHKTRVLTYDMIEKYLDIKNESEVALLETKSFEIVEYVETLDIEDKFDSKKYLYVSLPPTLVVQHMPITRSRQIAASHGMEVASRATIDMLKTMFKSHSCESCKQFTTVLLVKPSSQERQKSLKKDRMLTMTKEQKILIEKQNIQRKIAFKERVKQAKTEPTFQKGQVINDDDVQDDFASVFPPEPVDKVVIHEVVTAACAKTRSEMFEEAGCAVCGQLVPTSKLSKLSAVKHYLQILNIPGTTRQERFTKNDKIKSYPIAIDHTCNRICNDCRSTLRLGKVPRYALANGLWIGAVPEVLSSLRYIEKMLIA